MAGWCGQVNLPLALPPLPGPPPASAWVEGGVTLQDLEQNPPPPPALLHPAESRDWEYVKA